MIIGRGLLAMALREIERDDLTFYANGISNSVLEEIPRNNIELIEINEIANNNQDRTFVYFSTSQVNSVFNHSRAYVQHKLLAEELVKSHFEKYLVVRTSNLVGHNPWNTHTLFNYLSNALKADERITINPLVIRNFLDANHFTILLRTYLQNYSTNKIIEIVNPVSYTMDEIIREFEKFFCKRFLVERSAVNDFAVFDLNTGLSLELFAQFDIGTENYIPGLLKKYYRQHCAETAKPDH
jgi:nucleoside-diphosphate-sugar epimerase